MIGERIVISKQDEKRYRLLTLVLEGTVTLRDAAQAMGVSDRQAKRLKKSAAEGISGVVHGNRGREPANRLSGELRARVLELSEGRYSGFNDRHFAEMLAEREGISVGRETIRLLRRGAGIKPKRKRRPRKHHSRRPRKAAEGMMMLWDGSPHRWFGKQCPACCVMAAIDDATGKVLGLRFVDAESSWAYLSLLDVVVRKHGIPGSVYQDRHSVHKRTDGYWSIDEELAGRQDPTQVGAVLEALSIEPIFALTPQAKGRVEKLMQTLQDRLVAMLELDGIADMESANRYVDEYFIDYYNSHFAVLPEDAASAWRKPWRGLNLERTISLRYESTVSKDNAIRLHGMIIDIHPEPGGRSYADLRVEARQILDGSWRVYYQDKQIASVPATQIAEPIRTKQRRKGLKAAYESRWVYMASAPPKDEQASLAKTAVGSIRRPGPSRTIGATKLA
jgi:transposase